MLRHWITAIVALVSATAANAQTDWSGFYAGGNALGSRDKLDANDSLLITQISNLQVTGRGLVVVPGTTLPLNASGHKTNLDGGGQFGYQWQRGQLVFGAEADVDPFHRNVTASKSQQLPPTALTPATTIDASRETRIDRQWSARARVGYAFGRSLAYATGGYASARLNVFGVDTFTNPGGPAAACSPAPCQANLGPEGPNTTTDSNARKTIGGWRAGFGVEQHLSEKLSLSLEYLHSDFGARDITFHSSVTSFAGTFTHGDDGQTGTHGQINSAAAHVSLNSNALGLRVNFHF